MSFSGYIWPQRDLRDSGGLTEGHRCIAFHCDCKCVRNARYVFQSIRQTLLRRCRTCITAFGGIFRHLLLSTDAKKNLALFYK
ncbi:hypothetical protein TNCT_566241 [Trichonephila clavata]|uniref:Uncharacterized protein n=1 Tax=Trichonephila clavata TaxID=2740835 RepID=A0A8X6F4T8_TRICU|nr:hypothetical protein TNCT_566241 [Trichonephila clavata]